MGFGCPLRHICRVKLFYGQIPWWHAERKKLVLNIIEFTVMYNVVNLQAWGEMQGFPNYVLTIKNILEREDSRGVDGHVLSLVPERVEGAAEMSRIQPKFG